MVADLSVIEKDGAYYGCLDFDNSMIRYADERYLNIELIFEDESGLKIPKSAVVEKPYYGRHTFHRKNFHRERF